IQKAYEQCVAATGSPPGDEELAERAGMTLAQLHRTMQGARNQQFLSIHGLTEDGPALPSFLPADRGEPPEEQLERKELVEELARAIQQLPEKERLVIVLYYDRDLTMKESAGVLDITESRVSQLHASAVFRLSMLLRELR
ncbi:hypothetical protein LCGC14_2807860, partial [marine sediment metagenome]